jgi:translocation and assembly module TamB
MKKILKVLAIVVLTVLILLGILIWGIQTPKGQALLTDQINSYLRKKLQNRGRIEKLRFDVPDWVILEGVYLADLKGDTLLSARHLRVDLDMFSLIKGNVGINKIELTDAYASVYRTLPDTVFNFQYVADAFAGEDPDPADTTASAPMEMRLDKILLRNVRLSYRDAVIGTDATVKIDSAEVLFDKFNPTISQYHPTKIALSNSGANLRMYAGLQKPSPENPTPASDSLDLKLGDIEIDNFDWQFTDEASGLTNGVKVGRFNGHVNKVFLESQQVDVQRMLLENTSIYAEFAKKANPDKKVETTPAVTAANSTSPGWNVKVNEIKLVNDAVRYDDFNEAPIEKGLDYAHLHVKDLNLDLRDFVFNDDNIAGALHSGSFTEKSGFSIEQLKTNFAYGAQQTYLKNLFLKTPKTLLRDELVLKYDNLDQLSKDIAKVRVTLKLTDSQVAFKDILLLVPDLSKTPPFDKAPDGLMRGSGVINGTVDNLLISKARFSTLDGTILNLDGRIQGLPNTEKLNLDLGITELSSTKNDLLKVLPDSTLPSSIELPDDIKISGRIKGGMANIALTTTINTSFGTGTFSGTFKDISDSLRAQYNGTLTFEDFDLGKLLKQPPAELGKITLRTDIEGLGYAPKTMVARLDGNVDRADIKGYIYNNLGLSGNIDHGLANVTAKIDDENIRVNVNGRLDLSKEYPSVNGDISVKHVDLTALNLYDEPLQVKGDFKIDMQSTQPENPLGVITVNNLVLTHQNKPISVADLSVQLRDSSGIKLAVVESPFLNARMQGEYVYTEVADAVFTEVGKHFKVPSVTYKEVTTPVNFTLDAAVTNHPIIQSFVPALKEIKPVVLHAKLDNKADSTIIATLQMPLVDYDSLRAEGIAVRFSNTEKNGALDASLRMINSGSFRMQNTSLNSTIVDNKVRFDFTVRDSATVDQHSLKGDLLATDNRYRLNLRDNLLLNYRNWQTDTSGYIQYATDSVLVKNFAIRKGNQSILVNSTKEEPNSPLDVEMNNISIGPMIAIVTRDSTLATGLLNGKILLSNYMVSPTYTGRLTIDSLAVTKIPVGNLSLRSTNETENLIRVGASLISDKNEIRVGGSYNLKEEKSPLNFNMDIKKLSASTIEAFSFGQLQRATGNLTGTTKITGSTDSPRLNGSVSFDKVAFNATQLGARYSLDGQKIQFNDQNINFNNFIIADSLNQQMKVNGNVNIATIPDVGYNLTIGAKNFTLLNSTQKQNELFFGRAAIDANLTIKGRGGQSVIDGKVKVDPGSNITVVLPNDATEAGDASKGVIEFVDMSDSTQVAMEDSLDLNQIKIDFASQISLDIDVDDKSEFKVVIDELNGDNIKLKGNAQLNTGIAPNGQLYLIGAYDLTEGSYDLTLQILKRNFKIKKGSTLIWTGDPMKADLNITAAYEVMVDPGSIDNNYKGDRKIPIEVQIIITGNLTTPNITFNVTPGAEVGETVKKDITDQTFWNDMVNNPSEMNKQAFALLITNRFITDQTSSGFNIGSSAEAVARQSVSQLLSDQLNNLASDLVKGVNLDLNLNSTTDQSAGARTDLNVGLSKAFLGDRLKISVGKNFELESKSQTPSSTEVFDNIALDYTLSKDGRYLFRGYRKNQYQSILEGFIVETGVSFIVTADYDLFREIFQKQKNED